jgi:hypothetical protein
MTIIITSRQNNKPPTAMLITVCMPLHLQPWIDGAYESCIPNHRLLKHSKIAPH